MSKQHTKCHCGNERRKLWHLVCEECWNKVPAELQSEVYHAYKSAEGGPRHRIAVRHVFKHLEQLRASQKVQVAPVFGLHQAVIIIEDLPGGLISVETKFKAIDGVPIEGMFLSPALTMTRHAVEFIEQHMKIKKEVA